MNIKHTITSILSAAATLMLVSCGVQIQMERPVPAQTDLGRKTAIKCSFPTGSQKKTDTAHKIVKTISNRIFRSYYYVDGNTYGNHTLPAYDLHVNPTIKYGSSQYAPDMLYVTFTIRNLSHQQVYNKTFSEKFYSSLSGDLDEACEKIANSLVDELTPHTVKYNKRISTNSDNPSIEEGAKACAKGYWAQGRTHAQRAIETNPNDAEAYYLMGLIERFEKNFEQSTLMFQKANSIEQKEKYRLAIQENINIARDTEAVRQQEGY